jgi:hypothetical protein
VVWLSYKIDTPMSSEWVIVVVVILAVIAGVVFSSTRSRSDDELSLTHQPQSTQYMQNIQAYLEQSASILILPIVSAFRNAQTTPELERLYATAKAQLPVAPILDKSSFDVDVVNCTAFRQSSGDEYNIGVPTMEPNSGNTVCMYEFNVWNRTELRKNWLDPQPSLHIGIQLPNPNRRLSSLRSGAKHTTNQRLIQSQTTAHLRWIEDARYARHAVGARLELRRLDGLIDALRASMFPESFNAPAVLKALRQSDGVSFESTGQGTGVVHVRNFPVTLSNFSPPDLFAGASDADNHIRVHLDLEYLVENREAYPNVTIGTLSDGRQFISRIAREDLPPCKSGDQSECLDNYEYYYFRPQEGRPALQMSFDGVYLAHLEFNWRMDPSGQQIMSLRSFQFQVDGSPLQINVPENSSRSEIVRNTIAVEVQVGIERIVARHVLERLNSMMRIAVSYFGSQDWKECLVSDWSPSSTIVYDSDTKRCSEVWRRRTVTRQGDNCPHLEEHRNQLLEFFDNKKNTWVADTENLQTCSFWLKRCLSTSTTQEWKNKHCKIA